MTAAVTGLLVCGPVRAEDNDAAIEEIQRSQQELKAEVQALRSDINTLRQMISGLQPGSGTPSASGVTLSQISKKLDQVIKDLAAVKKGQQPAKKGRQPDLTVYNVDLGDSPYKGPKDAPITIVEFSDFQCPYCIREWPKIKQLMDEYPNDVKVVYKHYPLSFHKKAPPAQAATILAKQEFGNEGFWKMHDLIVANPKALDIPSLRKHAESLGMNLQTFDEVMGDQKKITALYADDMKVAAKCKVRGTPTILINGLKLANRSLAGYKARIDEILKKKPEQAGSK